jgi:hypothetical protein
MGSLVVGALACSTAGQAPDELSGTWRLTTLCAYERMEGPPCEPVTAATAEVISFSSGSRFTRQRPDEEGIYRLEARVAPSGAQEVLIYFDDGVPAQVDVTGDSLVVSWAYIDGPEKRYVRDR